MNAQFVIAMALVLPVVLLPVAFVWYLNIGGILKAVRKPTGAPAGANGAILGRGQ